MMLVEFVCGVGIEHDRYRHVLGTHFKVKLFVVVTSLSAVSEMVTPPARCVRNVCTEYIEPSHPVHRLFCSLLALLLPFLAQEKTKRKHALWCGGWCEDVQP